MGLAFISHSSHDDAFASEVQSRLAERGLTSLFLDFDPAMGIPAGRDWEQELYARLRACRVVIVLCSAESMTSKWVFAEIAQARSLGKHILPVKVGPCAIEGLISDRQAIDLTEDRERGYEQLWRGLLAAGLDPDDVFTWDGHRPPYPGLLAFQEADAALFFGRDDEVSAGLDLLSRTRRRGSREFVMVLGASGSGKSSLMRAGLMPRLRRDPARWMVLDPIRPRHDLVSELSAALSTAFADAGRPRDRGAIRDLLDPTTSEPAEAADALVAISREVQRLPGRHEATLLVVVDQFEEFFSGERPDLALRTLDMLRDAADKSGPRLLVVGTMRSDFLGDFQTHPTLRDLRYEALFVGAMSTAGITQVIERPANVAGIELETGLVNLLVDETRATNGLPLLAFTLRELWEKHGADGRLEIVEYSDALGGLHGAVARVAGDVLDSAELDDEREGQLRQAMLAMVRLSDEDRWLRRTVRWDNLPEPIRPVLERFVDARLLVASSEGGHRTIEVAHEALFRSWDQLSRWLDANAEALRLRRDIHRSAEAWQEGGRSDEDTWRGARLGRATELLERGDLALDPLDRDFVDASCDLATTQQADETRRRRRRLQISAAVAACASIIAAIAIFFFFDSQRQTQLANQQAALALARQAEALVDQDPALALAIAAEVDDRPSGTEASLVEEQARAALLDSGLLAVLRGHTDQVVSVAFSPDGSRLVTTGFDSTARIWNRSTGEQLAVLPHPAQVVGAEFSGDGSLIVTAGGTDGTTRVWDAIHGDLVDQFEDHRRVTAVAVDAQGRRFATAGSEGTAVVRDLSDQTTVTVTDGRQLEAIAISPDGKIVVTVPILFEGAPTAWDADTGDESHTLDDALASDVNAVAFSDDGTLLATGHLSGLARLWEARTGEPICDLTGHDRDTWGVRGVSFHPDGSRIVTASADTTAKVWDVETCSELTTLERHTGLVWDVAFDKDGSSIATASADGTAAIWQADGSLIHRLAEQDSALTAVAFSPDGRRIATASEDGTTTVWQTATGAEEVTLPGHGGPVVDVAFNHDGTRIATAGQGENPVGRGDDTGGANAQLWDADTGELLATLEGHEGSVLGVAFNQDGTGLATASWDGTTRIWNVVTGDERLVIPSGQATAVAFSHDGAVVAAVVQDGTAKLWNATTGALVDEVPARGQFRDLDFDHDSSRIVLGSTVGSATVSSLSDDTTIELAGQSPVHAVAFSEDGRRIATAGDDARIWAADEGTEIWRLTRPYDIADIALHPDGTLLATAGTNGVAEIFSLGEGEPCELVKLIVTSEELSDALGGNVSRVCTELRDSRGYASASNAHQ